MKPDVEMSEMRKCLERGGRVAVQRQSRGGRLVVMLYWALIFLIVAIIAAVLGFGGIAQVSAGIAQILFFVFLVLFVIALVFGMSGKRSNR